MSGANDPYDPKQVAALSPEALDAAVDAAVKAFAGAGDLQALAAVRPAHLGDRAPVLLARRELGALPPVERFASRAGVGVAGRVEGHDVEVCRGDGAITVRWDGQERAQLVVRDTVKPTSAEAVRELEELGLRGTGSGSTVSPDIPC